MNRLMAVLLAAVPLLVTALQPAPNPMLLWWTTHALEKVRPYALIPGERAQSVELYAAANEFEPFQIVLRSETRDVVNVDVELSDLNGPQGRIPRGNITAYFEGFMDLPAPSSIEGTSGEWPDPLIPQVDRYTGEKRNAFPFRVKRGRNQPLWIEIYIPQQTSPGIYEGNVHILVGGKRTFAVPVRLRVWGFSLPSTSSLKTSFGMNGVSAVRKHYGRFTSDDDLFQLTHLYQKAALWHRISIHGGSMAPPPFERIGRDIKITWSRYDAEVGPFLDGSVFSTQDPLPGAKATSIDLRTRGELETNEDKIAYWRDFVEHFREKGWMDRLFNYLWDEPDPGEFSAVLSRGKLVHRADPRIRNLVTSPLREEWSGIIDIWSPLINCFESKQGHDFCDTTAGFDRYSSEIKKGKKLWWYQSCGSHGCQTSVGEYFRGWPSYMIDNTGVANRIMQWEAWKYGIDGELYFNTTEAFTHKGDPWKSVFLFTGNGDGTMFYPGRPEMIGGRTHVPVESIRLKLVREGLEDYEYLALLDRRGGSDVAMSVVNRIVRRTYDFEKDPAALYEARFRIGEELNKRAGIGN